MIIIYMISFLFFNEISCLFNIDFLDEISAFFGNFIHTLSFFHKIVPT